MFENFEQTSNFNTNHSKYFANKSIILKLNFWLQSIPKVLNTFNSTTIQLISWLKKLKLRLFKTYFVDFNINNKCKFIFKNTDN
jgi:hypothetical protein